MEGLAKDLVNHWQRTEERKGSSVPSAPTWPRSCNEEKPKRRKVGKGRKPRPTQSPETQTAKCYPTLRQKRVRVQGFGSPCQPPMLGHWTHPPKWCGHGYSSENVSSGPLDTCLTLLWKRQAPALERGPTELTFKGSIDMDRSKRGLKEGTSRDDSHSLVDLVNDGHQAGLFLDLDLRRQETSHLARVLCPLTPGARPSESP